MTHNFDGARRGFLKYGFATMAATAALCSTSAPALAALPRLKGIRSLAFHNLHTDERVRIDYWRDGQYDNAAYAKFNHILRDHYSGDIRPMDPRLMDLLHDIQTRVENDRPIEIISGYRSPKTNMMLASYSDGVAKHSYHTKGMAVDIRLNGTPLSKLYHTAEDMRRGGAGFYPDSQFVHVDVGPVRRW
jgi:uncharacterized protein YcbK (DUF882 family)